MMTFICWAVSQILFLYYMFIIIIIIINIIVITNICGYSVGIMESMDV